MSYLNHRFEGLSQLQRLKDFESQTDHRLIIGFKQYSPKADIISKEYSEKCWFLISEYTGHDPGIDSLIQRSSCGVRKNMFKAIEPHFYQFLFIKGGEENRDRICTYTRVWS